MSSNMFSEVYRGPSNKEVNEISNMARVVVDTMCFMPPDFVPEEYHTTRQTALAMVIDNWRERGISAAVIDRAVSVGTTIYSRSIQ